MSLLQTTLLELLQMSHEDIDALPPAEYELVSAVAPRLQDFVAESGYEIDLALPRRGPVH